MLSYKTPQLQRYATIVHCGLRIQLFTNMLCWASNYQEALSMEAKSPTSSVSHRSRPKVLLAVGGKVRFIPVSGAPKVLRFASLRGMAPYHELRLSVVAKRAYGLDKDNP